MKKSELRQLIREEVKNIKEFENQSNLEADINDLFYNFKNSEDMTMAGYIDSYLIDKKYDGSSDRYDEEDGYDLRDKIINNLTMGLQNKLNRILDNI
jgi:hypothetical protein